MPGTIYFIEAGDGGPGEWFEPANQMIDELVNIDELCCLED